MNRFSLGEVATVSNGKTPPVSEQRGSGFPVLKIRDVDSLGNFRGPFGSFVDGQFAAKFNAKQLEQGDTLILNAAHNADYVASKTFYAKSSLGGPLVTGEWTIVRPNPATADSAYIRHFIESSTAKQQLKEMVNGIHLYPKDVARLSVPLPPLPEQRRIAAILDKADALRAKRREAIAKLDQLLQAVFLDMFGDPVTNPKGWPRTTFGDLIKVKSGDGLTAQNMKADGRHPVYGGNGVSGYHDQFMFKEPQLVIGRVGVYCGVVHRTKPKSWVTDNALYVSAMLRPMNQAFLKAILTAANFNQYAGRAAQPLVSGSRIYPVETICPPIDLQDEYDRRVCSVSDRSLQMDAQNDLISKLFSSLQDSAFSDNRL